jgi:hypothetical protein
LNQIFRRLRYYEGEDQWIGAVRDGVSNFAAQFGIFTQKDNVCLLRAQANLGVPENLEIRAASAHAFAAALESRDPVVALRSRGEVGPSLSIEPPSSRAHLFPITNTGRAVALIFVAENDPLDVTALELIAMMASAVLERRSNLAIHSQIASAAAHQTSEADRDGEGMISRRAPLPPWNNLSEDQLLIHQKARRFSRVAVADMEMRRPEGCRAGREQNDLYMFLQSEIDKARENYRKQFMTTHSMVDYLHLELINTAAEGDEHKLGADYPGQLL